MTKAEKKVLKAVNKLVDDSGIKKIKLAVKLNITPEHLSYVLHGKRRLTEGLRENIEYLCS